MLLAPGNPAELAKPLAENMFLNGRLDEFIMSPQDEEQQLIELERMADSLNLLDKNYFVRSSNSFIIPASFDADDPEVSHYQFRDGLDFRGHLCTYSIIRIGNLLGRASISAVCLTFENATLLPYLNDLETSDLLHTPVFAVNDMEQL